MSDLTVGGQLGGCPFAGFASVLQCLKVIFNQFHDQRLIARATPAIALDTADQWLAVVVDLDEWATAMRAVH
jgi:hypothetical protein